MNHNHKFHAVGGIFLLAVLVVAAGFISFNVKPDKVGVVKSISFKAAPTGLEVELDKTLVKQSVSQADKEQGQLWRLVQPEGSKQQFAISAHYESGESLKKLTAATGLPIREAVIGNAQLQLPKQYPSYKLVNQKNLTLNGTEATEMIFEYESQNITIRQRLLLLFKNSSTVVYIRAQARTADFDEVNSRYFTSLIKSVKFTD